MLIRLFTKDGGFVHEQEIVPFVDPPDVIVWGQRIFSVPSVDGPVGRDRGTPDDTHVYEEAFSYSLPPT